MNRKLAKLQNGFTLTEALVAFGITAAGLLAMASFQADLFSKSAYNKARTEALALAQQKIEELKHYTLADRDAYIDENGDGVMDADGNYAENPITGQNAVFTRSWDLSTVTQGRHVDVTVSWLDSSNVTQSVMLTTDIPWISPRSGADQIADLGAPLVPAPTGRARLGEGNLADYNPSEIRQIPTESPDQMSIYKHNDNLLLADVNGDVLLTLVDACATQNGTCVDFVRISGTVYKDVANSDLPLQNVAVIASDAAYCSRWVETGSLDAPPTTAGGNYEFYNYTCYLGGGWHGNIGFVKAGGLQQKDKFCQGDPTSMNAWEQPVIATRRAYRGMIQETLNGVIRYTSHGIRDAATFTGQDFVFTELDARANEGSNCVGADAPMTRTDSVSGTLFTDNPTDFVCLNEDNNGDGAPDFLDGFDTSRYTVNTYCPYDPTDPPVQSHTITGTLAVAYADEFDVANFTIQSSDGPGNCTLVTEWTSVAEGLAAKYACNVYDWGNGWTGHITVQSNSTDVYCPSPKVEYSGLQSSIEHQFQCAKKSNVVMQGMISLPSADAAIYSITMTDAVSGETGQCEFDSVKYYCVIPYVGWSWSGTMTVEANMDVCGSDKGVFYFAELVDDLSPYYHDLVLVGPGEKCPLIEPTPVKGTQ